LIDGVRALQGRIEEYKTFGRRGEPVVVQ
jgi:hypothetical protein